MGPDTIRWMQHYEKIASSTHSAASRPVVDHGIALQDVLSAWCRNVQEVQESLMVPTQDNLTKALADTRVHFCELQGVHQASKQYLRENYGEVKTTKSCILQCRPVSRRRLTL